MPVDPSSDADVVAGHHQGGLVSREERCRVEFTLKPEEATRLGRHTLVSGPEQPDIHGLQSAPNRRQATSGPASQSGGSRSILQAGSRI